MSEILHDIYNLDVHFVIHCGQYPFIQVNDLHGTKNESAQTNMRSTNTIWKRKITINTYS